MEKTFFVYEIEYNEKKFGFDLYCIDENWKKFKLFYKFYPKILFCYENEKVKSEIMEILKKLGKKIISIKEKELLLFGEPKKVIEVYCLDRKTLNELGSLDIEGIKKFEFDIGFKKQFTRESKINFFEWYKGTIENSELKNFEKLSDVDWENLKIAAIDIEVYNYRGNPRIEKDAIILISIVSKNFEKVIAIKEFEEDEEMKGKVIFVRNELELLKKFEEVINELDPDILLTYNGDSFDLPYLRERAEKYKFRLSLLGEKIIYRRKGFERVCKIGKLLHIDLYKFVSNILAPTLQSETYSLDSVAREILGEEKIAIDKFQMWKMFESGKEQLLKLAKYNLRDAKLTYLLGLKFIPFIIELSKITKLPPFDSSRSSYSMLVEAYLIEKAPLFNEIVPRRPKEEEVRERMMKTYEGAFVFQPKPGLYKDIVAFDFRSLYPSIIMVKNICLRTINKGCKEEDRIYDPDKRNYFCKNIKGFIPTILKEIAEKRFKLKEKLKKLKKDSKEYHFLYSKQYALKTILNSTYGYLGFPRSRWYCIEAARSITSFGRYYIKMIIDEFNKNGFKVIYGDTDSVFILLNGKSIEDALKLSDEINKKIDIYLEFQGYYKAGIFVAKKESEKGAKKKYALIDKEGNIVIKGFEYVRRDWCELTKELQRKVIEIILREGDLEKAREEVNKVINELKKGKIPIEKLAIYVQLTRELKSYEVKAPHIAAARKALEKGYHIEPGMIIAYVIVKGPGKISDKATLLEIAIKEKLKYDENYYINHQILPAVQRIFESLKMSLKDIGKQKTLFSFAKKD